VPRSPEKEVGERGSVRRLALERSPHTLSPHTDCFHIPRRPLREDRGFALHRQIGQVNTASWLRTAREGAER
jgi:hypothetical protein